MLPGIDDSGESRMGEISMSDSTREREAAVIGLWAFHSVLSSLLYCKNPFPLFSIAQNSKPTRAPCADPVCLCPDREALRRGKTGLAAASIGLAARTRQVFR